MPTSTAVGVAGVMTLVAQKSFASNAVEFAALSGDYRYVLYLALTCADVTIGKIELNGETTATNYYDQFMNTDNAVYTAARENANNCVIGLAGGNAVKIDVFRDESGYLRYFALCSGSPTNPILRTYAGGKSNATATEVTAIKILKTATGTSLAGTATLYKMAAV